MAIKIRVVYVLICTTTKANRIRIIETLQTDAFSESKPFYKVSQ